jgi:hypothetical protein
MKLFLLLTFYLFGVLSIFAQQNVNRYEVELLENPNPGKKDTREVNSVLIFEKESVKVISRRSNEVFKEIKYSELISVEHSFSKNPFYTNPTRTLILTTLTGMPLLTWKKEKHWLAIVGENGFAVLKIENDNYRLIKMEFAVKKVEVENINEDRQ